MTAPSSDRLDEAGPPPEQLVHAVKYAAATLVSSIEFIGSRGGNLPALREIESSLSWLASHLPSLLESQRDGERLRQLLWIRHHQTTEGLYGDDGEMQCSRCMIDFKRDTVEHIADRFARLNWPSIEAIARAASPEDRR